MLFCLIVFNEHPSETMGAGFLFGALQTQHRLGILCMAPNVCRHEHTVCRANLSVC